MHSPVRGFLSLLLGFAGLFLILGAPACPSTANHQTTEESSEVKAADSPKTERHDEGQATVGGFDAGNPAHGGFDAGNPAPALTVGAITGQFKKVDGKCPVDHMVYVSDSYSQEIGLVDGDCSFKKEIKADTTLGIAAIGGSGELNQEWSVFDFGKNQNAATFTTKDQIDLGKDIPYKPFDPAVPTSGVSVPEAGFTDAFGVYKPGLIENRKIGALKPCPANQEGVKIALKKWSEAAGKPGSAVNEMPMANGVELDIYSYEASARSGALNEKKDVYKGKMEAGFARTFGLATIDDVAYTVECRSSVTQEMVGSDSNTLLLKTACYYSQNGVDNGKFGACYYWNFAKAQP